MKLFPLLLILASTHVAISPLSVSALEPTDAMEKGSLPFSEPLKRADLYFPPKADSDAQVDVVLLFLPGRNKHEPDLLDRSEWQAFAAENQIGLCVASFAEGKSWSLENTYSVADNGTGEQLLSAIEERYGNPEIKLLVYGYSAGARWASTIAEYAPERVVAWCGQAVGKWIAPKPNVLDTPPGIIACGEWDGGGFQPSYSHFLAGRRLNRPWNWISLAVTGLSKSNVLYSFVRAFFSSVLVQSRRADSPSFPEASFWDIDLRLPTEELTSKRDQIFGAWLPSNEVRDHWLRVHCAP